MTHFSDLLATAPERPAISQPRPSGKGPAQTAPAMSAEEDVANIGAASRLVFFTDPSGAGADRFRFLRMRLQELRAISNVRSVLITSPLPEDGKTTAILNLATALAEGGRRSVVVVEGDLHHPSVAARLDLPSRTGLAECLQEGLDPKSAIRRVLPLDWFLLQAGKCSVNPTELIQSNALALAIAQLAARFDWVLIDSPPVVPLTDAVWLSRQASAALVVVRAGRTSRQVVEQAVEILGPKKVFGILFNGAEHFNKLYTNYAKYYRRKRSDS